MVESLVVTDVSNNVINEWDKSTAEVNVTQPSGTVVDGSSSAWTTALTPDNQGVNTAYLADGHLKFKMSNAVPKGTTVEIAASNNVALGASGNLKDLCFSSKIYTSCEVNSSKVKLVFGEDIAALSEVELYLSQTYALPNAAGQSTTGWRVEATYSGNTIVNDIVTGVQAWTPGAAVTGTITSQSLTMTNNNAGEYSDYTFSFKTDTGYTVGETIEISFPHEFDPFVGGASQWFSNEPGTYYL